MKITIHCDGHSYTSTVNNDTEMPGFAAEMSDLLSAVFGRSHLSCIKLNLESGGVLLLGKEAVQRCAIVVTH